ncbi:MAG: short-chain dehydrogenase, partial [Planctomycetota bacterium]
MEIEGRKLLVLGGYGLVGFEVAKQAMAYHPREIVILSLKKEEVEMAQKKLEKLFPHSSTRFSGEYGNIFISHELKDTPLGKVKRTESWRKVFTSDIFSELDKDILNRSFLYQVIQKHKPDIVVDCVNTATAISYQNIFETSRELQKSLDSFQKIQENIPEGGLETLSKEELLEYIKEYQNKASKLAENADISLSSLYIPQLVRHIQILYHALRDGKVKCYIKVGTSGTGGMGLNIPYTHGEERPSRVLLSKSAVAGAHTLLLFLLARTPDAPVIKEIKPAAAIAWRAIEYGKIQKGAREVRLYNVPEPQEIGERICLKYTPQDKEWNLFASEENPLLQSVYIDTGENGLFSKSEFEAITFMQQMEYVTPEEIAKNILFEVQGRNTGKDVLNALDSSSMGPTYRAGYLRTYALSYMRELEEQYQCSSVAFEMLGPPRISKLLFECHLLKLVYQKISTLIKDSPQEIAEKVEELILQNKNLASQ